MSDSAADRESLRDRLKSRAYALLSALRLRRPLARSVTVRAADRAHAVTLTVGPRGAGSTGSTPERFPGLHFSAIEAAAYQAVLTGPLIGKEIARKIGQPYDGRLRVILANLVDRRVLRRAEGGGYAAATPDDKGVNGQG